MLKRNKTKKKIPPKLNKTNPASEKSKTLLAKHQTVRNHSESSGIASICIILATLPVSLKGKGTWQTSSITGFENKTLWAEFHANRKLLSLDLIKRASLH